MTLTPRLLKYGNTEVKNIVEPYPIFVGVYDTLRDAMSYMLMHDMHALCVIDDNGDFIGTISLNNIQKCILNIYSDDADDE